MVRAAFGGILAHHIPWIHDVLSSGRIYPLLWPWKMLRDGGALFAPPSAAKPSNAMIRIARKRLSECLSPVSWKALWRFRVILVVAAFALRAVTPIRRSIPPDRRTAARMIPAAILTIPSATHKTTP